MSTVSTSSKYDYASAGSDYAVARAGTGTIAVQSDSWSWYRVGQTAGATYYVFQTVFRLPLYGVINHERFITGLGLDLSYATYPNAPSYGHAQPWDTNIYSVGWPRFVGGDDLGLLSRLAYIPDGAGWGACTLDGSNLEDLIGSPATRPSELWLCLASSRQVSGDAPDADSEVTSGQAPQLTLTYTLGGWYMAFDFACGSSAGSSASNLVFESLEALQSRFRYRAAIPKPRSGTVKAYDHDRIFLGPLPGEVGTVEKLDGANSLSVTFPRIYGKADGTTDDRTAMITGAWYLEHQGNWYRAQTYTEEVIANRLPVEGLGAEIELDDFLTNYGQMPFSMVGTPSEIATAILSGQPECEWYNGDFADLDDVGFPVGWIPGDASQWDAYTGSGGPGVEVNAYTGGEATLESLPINHTSGAEIKLALDVWTEIGFDGTIEAVLSWRNSRGIETSSVTLTPSYAAGEWVTFADDTWRAVANEKCVLKLKITNNTSGYAARFRSVRFVQNEDNTGWSYEGELDTRTATLEYDDASFIPYGGWALDHTNEVITSSTIDDVLAVPFTGDEFAVQFASGGAGATADIYVDGAVLAAGLSVAAACSISGSGFNKRKAHLAEIIVRTDGAAVSVSGVTLSDENIIAVTWHRTPVYEAFRNLKTLVGGEYEWQTADRKVFHDAQIGEDLTATNVLWLREGADLLDLVPDTSKAAIKNRCYYSGYGDGAFQLGVRVDSRATRDGATSQTLYGVRRFCYTNKAMKSITSAIAEAIEKSDEGAFAAVTYRGTVTDAAAALIHVGDTVRVTHQLIGTESLRALEVSRSSSASTASVLFWDRSLVMDAAAQDEATRRAVEQLLRAY